MPDSTGKLSLHFPPARISLPILALFGYGTFLITGFDIFRRGNNPDRALPLYIFFSLLLLGLQAIIAESRSAARLIYLGITSALSLVYAAGIVFYSNSFLGQLAHKPSLYVIIELLLFGIFIYDAIDRRRQDSVPLDASASSARIRASQRKYGSLSPNQLAIDFTGLAILLFTSWGLLSLLNQFGCNLIQTSCPSGFIQFANLPIPAPLPSPLPTLDAALGFGALAITLLLLGMIGMIAAVGSGTISQPPNGSAWHRFQSEIKNISGDSFNEVLLSLRLTLSPLVWIIPAFSMALFSGQFTSYFAQSAGQACPNTVTCIGKLFNPFQSLSNYGLAFFGLALGIISVLAVIAAVSVAEHDAIIIRRAINVFGMAGRAVALTLFIFFLSLSCINAFILFFNHLNPAMPFQVGPASVLALLAFVIFIVYETIRAQLKKR